MEAAGIEPVNKAIENPKQDALLPANALISHRIVPSLRPVSSRLVPFSSSLEGHTGAHAGLVVSTVIQQGLSGVGSVFLLVLIVLSYLLQSKRWLLGGQKVTD